MQEGRTVSCHILQQAPLMRKQVAAGVAAVAGVAERPRKRRPRRQYAVVECSARTFRPKAFWDADSGRFVLAEPIILRNLKRRKNYWTLSEDQSPTGIREHPFDIREDKSVTYVKQKSSAKRRSPSKKPLSSEGSSRPWRQPPRYYSAPSSVRERHMSFRPSSVDSGLRQQTRSINVAATVRKSLRPENNTKNTVQPATRCIKGKTATPQANDSVAKPPGRSSQSGSNSASRTPVQPLQRVKESGRSGTKTVRNPRSESVNRRIPCSKTSSCTSRLPLRGVTSATSTAASLARPTTNSGSSKRRGPRKTVSNTNTSTATTRCDNSTNARRKQLKTNSRCAKKDNQPAKAVESIHNMHQAACTPREAIKILKSLQASRSMCSIPKAPRSTSVASRKRQGSQPAKSTTNLQKSPRGNSGNKTRQPSRAPSTIPSNWRLLLPCSMSVRRATDRSSSKRASTAPTTAASSQRAKEEKAKASVRSPTHVCVDKNKSRALIKILRDGSHSVPTLVVTLPPPLSKPSSAHAAASTTTGGGGKRRSGAGTGATASTTGGGGGGNALKQCASKTSSAANKKKRERAKNASSQQRNNNAAAASNHAIRSASRRSHKARGANSCY